MAKGVYTCIDGVSRNVKKIPVCIDGVSRNTKTGYACIDGVSRQFFSGGTALSDLEVGTSVYMNVSGVRKEFLVVHQGRPSTAYDTSCDGTWLLMKDVYIKMKWDTTSNNYSNSDVHGYLNTTLVNLFDSDIANAIKQVKIPYVYGAGNVLMGSCTLYTGANGLSTKLFLLSFVEVGGNATPSYNHAKAEGAVLDYFNGASDSDRIAYLNEIATYWFLRSPYIGETSIIHGVANAGWLSKSDVTYTNGGFRPALILPSSAVVDENFNIIA